MGRGRVDLVWQLAEDVDFEAASLAETVESINVSRDYTEQWDKNLVEV